MFKRDKLFLYVNIGNDNTHAWSRSTFFFFNFLCEFIFYP